MTQTRNFGHESYERLDYRESDVFDRPQPDGRHRLPVEFLDTVPDGDVGE
jgi:hypothetical protein